MGKKEVNAEGWLCLLYKHGPREVYCNRVGGLQIGDFRHFGRRNDLLVLRRAVASEAGMHITNMVLMLLLVWEGSLAVLCALQLLQLLVAGITVVYDCCSYGRIGPPSHPLRPAPCQA